MSKEKFIKVSTTLLKILDDPKLSIYYHFLEDHFLYQRNGKGKNKSQNKWFYVPTTTIKNKLPSSISNGTIRWRLDKKLEKLELIKTKRITMHGSIRKLYFLNTRKLRKLEKIKNEKSPKNGQNDVSLSKDTSFDSDKQSETRYSETKFVITSSSKKIITGQENGLLPINTPLRGREGLKPYDTLVIRRQNPPDSSRTKSLDVIKYWNSKGNPFATVRKIDLAIKSIEENVSKKESLPEIYNVIDLAYELISDVDFTYLNNHKMYLAEFFSPAKKFYSKNPKLEKLSAFKNHVRLVIRDLVPKRKKPTWFNVFSYNTRETLEKELLGGISKTEMKNHEEYNFLMRSLPMHKIKLETRDDYKLLQKAALLLEEFCIANTHGEGAMEYDFKAFIDEFAELKLHWLASRRFWNERYGAFLLDINRLRTLNEI